MQLKSKNNIIIGVLHLREFPVKKDIGVLKKIKQKAFADLSSLQLGGIDIVIIENEFDGPKSPYGEFLTVQQKKIMFEIVKKAIENKYKILFIIPPYLPFNEYKPSKVGQKLPTLTPPYGVLSIISYINQNKEYDIEILDLNYEIINTPNLNVNKYVG